MGSGQVDAIDQLNQPSSSLLDSAQDKFRITPISTLVDMENSMLHENPKLMRQTKNFGSTDTRTEDVCRKVIDDLSA